MSPLIEGQKVLFHNIVYDFGYLSATPGMAIIYEEGEKNMQDAFAVKISELTTLSYIAGAARRASDGVALKPINPNKKLKDLLDQAFPDKI